ncbi:MAG: L-seryl-tRNA(Sec) selenium transferase [Bryobacterales bacterium]|nr:L-seryl-tRNA(Sec) selenium transferase [Bryobacterales bacterium]
MNELLRQLPSVDEVAQQVAPHTAGVPWQLLITEVRAAIAAARAGVMRGSAVDPAGIPAAVMERLRLLDQPSLRPVINATGVILHTNLGRAPLAGASPGGSYSNLEYDLETGRRGKRDTHTKQLFERLLGKPGIVVNNNAAAVYLVLNELAAGAEVIVSRGQLVEIGDGFRIPDIMLRAGVVLREVGTTNRTRMEDYRDAITDRTALLLIVHPSNFRIDGFAGQPSRAEIVALGKERSVPVYEDLGSGCLLDLAPYGIHEPCVQECLRDGVGLVSFSCDKLLGGPQAGVIAGEAALLDSIRRNPMFRALRADKLIIQSLETTLRHYVWERYDAIPALRMIRIPAEELRRRAQALVDAVPELNAEVVPGESVIGGGSTPMQTLPAYRIAIESPSVTAWERNLREGDPAVIATIEGGRLMLDLRTVSEAEEPVLRERLRSLLH